MPRRPGKDVLEEAQQANEDAITAGRVSVAVGNPASLTVEEPGELNEPEYTYYFDSSRVYRGSYDPDSKRLFLTFQKPFPDAVMYVYEGVEANEWRNLQRSSAGRYVNRVLNGKDYRRVR